MRSTAEQRKNNARLFYENFRNGTTEQAAIIVERNNNYRTQFFAVPTQTVGNKIIIAESVGLGVEGCWYEFFNNIGYSSQKTYCEEGFKKWVNDTAHFNITYYDGCVFILEKTK